MGSWKDMWRAGFERKLAAKLAQQAAQEAKDPFVRQANDIVAGRGLGASNAVPTAKAPTTYAQQRFGIEPTGMKKGGSVKKMAKGGSASKRGDGIARKGKTKGKIV